MKEEEYEQKKYTLPHLNTILYGPPGTGKTYHTIKMAAEIIAGKKIDQYDEARKIFQNELKKDNSRIVFTTFHQNYSYEDFIQGIKPDIGKSGDTLNFKQKNGVFKNLVDKAKENVENSKKDITVLTQEEIFDDAINKFIEEKALYEGNEIDIEHTILKIREVKGTSFQYGGKDDRKTPGSLVFKHLKQMYAEGVKTREDIKNSNTLPNVVKNPGSISAYYNFYKMIMSYIESDSRQDVQQVALQNYVIIIDEINRANISRVFGEIITLIEPDKRLGEDHALSVTLPSGDEFSIPNNLYIIGTMNTADKSIALLDVALRRRFEFLPMYPLHTPEGKAMTENEVQNINLLRTLNEKIKQAKGPDFQIGHSYFMGKAFELKNVMNTKVIPLLLEYYRNDTNQVTELVNEALQEAGEKFTIPEKDIPDLPLRIIETSE